MITIAAMTADDYDQVLALWQSVLTAADFVTLDAAGAFWTALGWQDAPHIEYRFADLTDLVAAGDAPAENA